MRMKCLDQATINCIDSFLLSQITVGLRFQGLEIILLAPFDKSDCKCDCKCDVEIVCQGIQLNFMILKVKFSSTDVSV
jgi:hypothetical protein